MSAYMPTYAGMREQLSSFFSRGEVPVTGPVVDAVPAAALPRIQARVLSGEYHYDKNLIVLKVEHKKMGADGRYEAPTFEDVCYEVVSLNIKEKGEETPLELLGARTEAAIKPLMNELIKSFVGLEDARTLLKTTITQRADESDEYASAKGQLKTVTLSAEGAGEPTFDILDTYISKVGRELAHRAQDAFKTTKIQNFEVLKQLLAEGPFQSLIKTAKTTHEHSHLYVSNHPTIKEKTKLLEEMSEALFEKTDEDLPIFEYVERISTELCERQQDALFAAQAAFKDLKVKLERRMQEVEELQKADPNEIQATRLVECQGYLAKLEDTIEKIKSEIKHTQDLSSLVCFVKEKKVQDQRASFGSTAFTELHSEEWYRKLDALGLLDLKHWADFEGESEADHRTQARTILAENFEKRIPTEFGDFLDKLEGMQTKLNVEIARPLLGLDELSHVGDASEVTPIQLDSLRPSDVLSELSERDGATPISDAELESLRGRGSPDSKKEPAPAPLARPVDRTSVVDRPPPPADSLDTKVERVSAVLHRVSAPPQTPPDAASDAGDRVKRAATVVDVEDSDQAARVKAAHKRVIERSKSQESLSPAARAAAEARVDEIRKKRGFLPSEEVIARASAARKAARAKEGDELAADVEKGAEAFLAKGVVGPAVVDEETGALASGVEALVRTQRAARRARLAPLRKERLDESAPRPRSTDVERAARQARMESARERRIDKSKVVNVSADSSC